MTDQPPRLFVLWLDASDGSLPTHDGVVWPDGTTTLHHRHFGHTTTHHSVDAARQLTYGTQGRTEWPQPETTSQTARTAALARAQAFKTAALHVRGHSSDERYGRTSISTALCMMSDELGRMSDEEAKSAGLTLNFADGPVRCPLCTATVTLHTPDGARAHFTHVHPEQSELHGDQS